MTLGKVMVILPTLKACPRSTTHHGNASVDSVHECVYTLLSIAKLAANSVVISNASLLDDKQSAKHTFTAR